MCSNSIFYRKASNSPTAARHPIVLDHYKWGSIDASRALKMRMPKLPHLSWFLTHLFFAPCHLLWAKWSWQKIFLKISSDYGKLEAIRTENTLLLSTQSVNWLTSLAHGKHNFCLATRPKLIQLEEAHSLGHPFFVSTLQDTVLLLTLIYIFLFNTQTNLTKTQHSGPATVLVTQP